MDSCTLPIFSKLVFQEVCRWKSYTAPEKTVLMTNVQDSVFQLFQRVENKHGWMLVSHALAYVTASKNGVSEPEIEDFISLDDKAVLSRISNLTKYQILNIFSFGKCVQY